MFNKFLAFIEKSDQLILMVVFATIVATVLIIGTYGVIYNYLPPNLPLFYSLSWGQAQLINKQQFLILPFILVLLALINVLISFHLHPQQIVLKRIIIFHTIFIALAILITAIKIMFLFV